MNTTAKWRTTGAQGHRTKRQQPREVNHLQRRKQHAAAQREKVAVRAYDRQNDNAIRARLGLKRRLQTVERATIAKAAADGASPSEEKKILGIPATSLGKFVALAFMFFCILFNYTILRDTKVSERSRLQLNRHPD